MNDNLRAGGIALGMTAAGLISAMGPDTASATEPCGAFGECKVIVEINSTDGDIGFHWLADAEQLVRTSIRDPRWRGVYSNHARGPLRKQTLTETFGESSEPVCRDSLKEEEDEPVITLEDFRDLWREGSYYFIGLSSDWEFLFGTTELTYYLPAAPEELAFDDGVISWARGSTLGECATEEELAQFVAGALLPIHPRDVPLDSWEVVLELEDGSGRTFAVRLPPGQTSVTVPEEFMATVDPNTLAKAEVGAIGGDLSIGDNDNATFTEIGDICLNEQAEGCIEED